MFDRRKVDYFMMEIEDCIRNHAKNKEKRRIIREEIADLALGGGVAVEELTKRSARLQDVEFNISFYEKRLAELKAEFIGTIENIQIQE